MNFKEKKLIIFDLDGTLVNSIPDLTLALNDMLSHFDRKNFSEEIVSTWVGKGIDELLKKAIIASDEKALPLSLEKAKTYYESYYKNHVCEKSYLYNGVKDVLSYLKKEKYSLVICTNKPFQFIEPILRQLDIISFFDEWIGGDSLEYKKPHPKPLLYLAEKHKIQTKECVMVGDSKNDIIAAREAHIDSIGLTYGYNYNEPIGESNPDVVLSNFEEIKNLF